MRRGKPRAHAGTRAARAALAVGALVLAALLGGCAAETDLLRQDPGFTAETLRQGGLAVLGVVQVDEVAQVRGPLIAGLTQVLRATRRDVPLVEAARVEGAMPDSAYRLLLLGYQMRGEPDSLWLAVAANAARGMARYGVLARVESDAVRYGTRYVSNDVPGRQSESQVQVTGRDAKIAVDVYDLGTRLLVFRGRFIGASDAAPSFRPAAADSDSLELPLPTPEPRPVNPATGLPPIPGPSDSPAALGYPEAPPVSKAAEAAFVSFARSLPGAPPAASGGGR